MWQVASVTRCQRRWNLLNRQTLARVRKWKRHANFNIIEGFVLNFGLLDGKIAQSMKEKLNNPLGHPVVLAVILLFDSWYCFYEE